MTKKWIYTIVVFLLLAASDLWGQNSLPYPPREFFVELAKFQIPRGVVGCCYKLRKMLENSVMISPEVAVKLFQTGRILIGDARTVGEIQLSHISGALLLPHEKLDFMKLKPVKVPIALY